VGNGLDLLPNGVNRESRDQNQSRKAAINVTRKDSLRQWFTQLLRIHQQDIADRRWRAEESKSQGTKSVDDHDANDKFRPPWTRNHDQPSSRSWKFQSSQSYQRCRTDIQRHAWGDEREIILAEDVTPRGTGVRQQVHAVLINVQESMWWIKGSVHLPQIRWRLLPPRRGCPIKDRLYALWRVQSSQIVWQTCIHDSWH